MANGSTDYTLMFSSGTSQSMAASFNSLTVPYLGLTDRCAIHAVYTGSPVGVLKLQASNDNSNWADLEETEETISVAGNTLWNLSDLGFNYIRLVYTRTSGTGSLTATFHGIDDV